MRQAFESSNPASGNITLTLPDEGECVFDDYNQALNALQFITTDHHKMIRKTYGKYFDFSLPDISPDLPDLEWLMSKKEIRSEMRSLKNEWLKEM